MQAEAVPQLEDEDVTERVELPQQNPTPMQAAFWRLGMRAVGEDNSERTNR